MVKSEDGDVTRGGSTIHIHDEPAESTIEDSDSAMEEISEHIERHIGTPASVLHEIASEYVHIDVHWIEPKGDHDYHTLVTSGMSDIPMNTPEGAEEFKFSELVISLPYDWEISEEAFEDENNYFPIRLIKQLAVFPHMVNSWIWHGHTVPNGDPMEPYSRNTKLCCSLLTSPSLFSEEFLELKIRDDKVIHFFNIFPLYSEEVNFKLEHGLEELYLKLSNCGTDFVIDPKRKNVCKKRFGFF